MTLVNPKPSGHAVGEKLTSTNIDSCFSQLPKAIDGVGGGSYAPTAAINITGANALGNVDITGNATWTGATNLPKLGSRSYAYPQSMVAIANEGAFATWTGGSDATTLWTLTATTDDLWFAVQDLPYLGTITGITVYVHPQGGHAALPANMPAFEFFSRVVSTGTMTSAGTATDSSADVTAFQLYHAITLSSLTLANDGTRQFNLRVRGENGANSLTGMRLAAIVATVTVTQVAPG